MQFEKSILIAPENIKHLEINLQKGMKDLISLK